MWIAQDLAYGKGLDEARGEDVGWLPSIVLCAYGDNVYGISLGDFVDFINDLIDPAVYWYEGEVDLFDFTFKELTEYLPNQSLKGFGWGCNYTWFWNYMKGEYKTPKVPEHLLPLTLREWGHLVASTIDTQSYCERETWDSKGTYDKEED